MDFRTELHIKAFQEKINIRHKIMLVGSCFTDHMGSRLRQHKFQVLENPNGIVFNPISIANAIDSYIASHQYQAADLFFHNGLWASWHHHTQFSHPDQQACLRQINESVAAAHQFLQKTDWLVVTLGSSFVYELKNDSLGGVVGEVAANCHKVPAQHFTHRLPAYAEVEGALLRMVNSLQGFNPTLKIIFTISPVRHHREGLVENNRSKALLHTAVHQMVLQFPQAQYFPAYELVIDDLRDYRFYAEDMVHPNHQATQYVWEKLVDAAIDAESQGLMKQLLSLYHAKNHRPLHPDTPQHQQFLQTMHQKVLVLSQQHPFLPLQEELEYFGQR